MRQHSYDPAGKPKQPAFLWPDTFVRGIYIPAKQILRTCLSCSCIIVPRSFPVVRALVLVMPTERVQRHRVRRLVCSLRMCAAVEILHSCRLVGCVADLTRRVQYADIVETFCIVSCSGLLEPSVDEGGGRKGEGE